MNERLAEIFALCEGTKSSDVHLACGEIPRFRMQGQLTPHPAFGRLDDGQVDDIAMSLGLETLPVGCPDGTERVRATLMREGSIDGAVTSPGGTRYRFNIYRESGATAVALRRLDGEFRSLEELGLPPQLANFCECPDGLVVVTGPTGCGKSTTLATLIDMINRTRQGHVITLEDPIEFRHVAEMAIPLVDIGGFPGKGNFGLSARVSDSLKELDGVTWSYVSYSYADAKSFGEALVEALRQDPDVILVGEMRDLVTVRTALSAAETGHLVFATLHSGDCAGAIERLVSVFPAEEQDGVRRQLALTLRGIFAQHLLPAVGGGRVAACELMVNTVAVANMIATGRSAHVRAAIETGFSHGMVTLDRSLAGLLERGLIGEAAAMALSRSPETLRRRMVSARSGENG